MTKISLRTLQDTALGEEFRKEMADYYRVNVRPVPDGMVDALCILFLMEKLQEATGRITALEKALECRS
jgi:hypothetical protein